MRERPTATGSADEPADVIVGPWRRVSRRTAYRNDWLTLWHDEVVRPAGGRGIYGVVHFPGLALGVVALDADGRVLLVGQHRYTLDRWSWEIPEGAGLPDEEALAGAQRELAEETGYRARRWTRLVETHTSNSVTDESAVLFLAEELAPGPARPDETEELTVRWLALAEAVAMVEAGEITDAMSQVGILLTDRRAGRG
ncbi:MAG TPA: NUDIX hydrolase [Candidatus Limnocylindrales bacterium]|jgi:8-oxo-dGTP pyrophosphatase MutT (NUDIX family)|nr:NUDIX hydrolase [Candidatus Limnocylindrales bacterium]